MGRVSLFVRLAVLSLVAAGLFGVTGATAPAMIRAAPVAPVSAPFDFGDAPEGGPGLLQCGVIGALPHLPDDRAVRRGFVTGSRGIPWRVFGPGLRFRGDGNAGRCQMLPCFPPYDQDECFADGDAGLICASSLSPSRAASPIRRAPIPRAHRSVTPASRRCGARTWISSSTTTCRSRESARERAHGLGSERECGAGQSRVPVGRLRRSTCW